MNHKLRSSEKRFSIVWDANHRLYIDDDDFHWDVSLRINGDFESDAEKARYAEAIARVLSEHQDEIPYGPLEMNT